jgi:amidase
VSDTLVDELAALDATAHAELVRRGDLQPVELVEAAIARIEELNPALNAVITPCFERALATVEHGVSGPFAGVPFLLKDLAVELEGVRFCEGSRFTRDHVSTYTSEVVERMERAGLVILGKTNTPEFGMVPTTESERFGPTRNPWSTDRSTSGSSGGSAAAVASRMVPMAHADDLGGSIRYPAAACGLFGLKPSRGRISYAPEYGDVVSGWAAEFAVTRSVRDAATLLDALAGASPGDPYAAPAPTRPYAQEAATDPRPLRIGYTAATADGSTGHPDCVAALDATLAVLAELGHDVVETQLPPFDQETGAAIGTAFNAATAWIIGYWTRVLGRGPEPGDLEPLTQCYWEMGREIRAGDYLLAIESLQRLSRRIAHFLETYDVFVNPTMSEPPAPIGEITSTPDEPMRALVRGGRTVAYSGVIANFTGNPAMSVPAGLNADGLPMGVHVLGRFGDEAALLQLAGQLERAQPWAHLAPVYGSRRGRHDDTDRAG